MVDISYEIQFVSRKFHIILANDSKDSYEYVMRAEIRTGKTAPQADCLQNNFRKKPLFLKKKKPRYGFNEITVLL